MRSLRNLALRRKLTLISMVTSGVALLLACGVIIGYELVKARRAMLEEVLTLAQMIGDNSAAALTFDDPESAAQTIRSLGADKQIVLVLIYDADGQPFARYQPSGSLPLAPPPVQGPSHRFSVGYLQVLEGGFSDGYLEVFHKISVAGETIGTMYVRHSMI